MRGWGSRPVALAVAALAVGGTAPAAAEDLEARTALTFADERIDESSGLVDRGGVVLTVNDSGDGPVVYVVDKDTGATTGTLTYGEEVADVEALAPAGRGAVWVGDIGDNSRARPSLTVHRVPVPATVEGDRTVPAQSFRLVYPDSPHDAEALLTHPRTGRLYLVTKWVTGGTVYAAPAELRAGVVNRLEPVGRVPGLVTGGEFLPDGEHLVLRSYASARVLTFPDLDEVASFPLPPQEQGEALAVVDRDTALISTEGRHSEVLEVALPRFDVPTPAPSDPAPTEAAPTTPDDADGDRAAPAGTSEEDGGGAAAVAAVVVVLLGATGLTAARRRSRRSR